MTRRLRQHVAKRVGQGLAVSVAAEGVMSWPIAHAARVTHAQGLLFEQGPAKVLGIDETRRGRAVWRLGPDGRAG